MGEEDHGPQHLSRFPQDKEMEGRRSASAADATPGILEVRPQRVPGTRWHPLGLARGGETGGDLTAQNLPGFPHHHGAPLAYPRPFWSMGAGEGIPNLIIEKE